LFQWHPNSGLVAPTVGSILQTASMLSMYDWQNSNQFIILYDVVHSFAGTDSAPTASTNQLFFGRIGIGQAVKRSMFTTAAATGSEQFYLLLISDSLLAPSPNLSGNTRVTYCEE